MVAHEIPHMDVYRNSLLTVLVVPLRLAAQRTQTHTHRHHHYQFIDLGTFGAPAALWRRNKWLHTRTFGPTN